MNDQLTLSLLFILSAWLLKSENIFLMYSNLLTHATLTSLCARIIVFVLDSKEKAYYRKLALLIGYYG